MNPADGAAHAKRMDDALRDLGAAVREFLRTGDPETAKRISDAALAYCEAHAAMRPALEEVAGRELLRALPGAGTAQ